MVRRVVEATTQCTVCGHTRTLKRVRGCKRCGGVCEVLRTVDGAGRVTHHPEGALTKAGRTGRRGER